MTQETKIEPRSKALAYELMGVLADVDNDKFDDVCYGTTQRVMYELLGGHVGPAMPESVKTLVGHLREGSEMDSEGFYIGTDRIIEEAADALEAAYGVVAKDNNANR